MLTGWLLLHPGAENALLRLWSGLFHFRSSSIHLLILPGDIYLIICVHWWAQIVLHYAGSFGFGLASTIASPNLCTCQLPIVRGCWYTLFSFSPCSGAGRDEDNAEQHPPAGVINVYTGIIFQAGPASHSWIAVGCTVCAVSEGIV